MLRVAETRGGDVTGGFALFGGTSNKRCVWRWLPQPITATTGQAHACTQTDLEYVTPARVIECVAPAPAVTFVVPSQQLPPVFTTTTVTADDLEEFSAPVCNQVYQELIAASEASVEEYIAPAPAVYAAPAHVEEYIAPAPAVYAAPAPVEKFLAPAPAVCAAPAPVVELLPVPAVVQVPTPAVEHIAPLPVVFQAPTPAVENIAPLRVG